jgi:ATP-binding protein involved in chromosome partitioning
LFHGISRYLSLLRRCPGGLCPRSGVLYITRTGSARASFVLIALLPRISCGHGECSTMTQVSRDQVLEALAGVVDPARRQNVVALDMVSGIVIKGSNVGFALEVEPSEAEAKEPLRQACERAVLALPGVTSVTAVLTAERTPAAGQAPRPTGSPMARGGPPPGRQPAPAKPGLPGIRSVIAVASGKGGVGKSTTSANLALGLARLGQRVGLLDADIYGPSQPRMLGITGKPSSPDGKKLRPMANYGVRVMSMGFLVDEDAPMIWRGPMVQSAIQQMLTDVEWGELDVLVVDLPPGTGDAQLTMAQRVPLAGAVIVSTPQDIALLDARKALNMFRKVDVPVLGIVENMSYFVCPHCGGRSEIFSHGGARATAEKFGVDFLGEIPLDLAIREQTDAGRPPVVAEPDGPQALAYLNLARMVLAKLDQATAAERRPFPKIVYDN